MGMRALVAIAAEITGKAVYPDTAQSVHQDESTIYVPYDDQVGLVHEILHWIVASDREREWPNLGLDGDDSESTPDPGARERQVSHLEAAIYASKGITAESGWGEPTDRDRKRADKRVNDMKPMHGDVLRRLSRALDM